METIPLVNKPMHARYSFHQSSLQLSFITQAWIFKLKLVLCKQTYEMHIQMHHTSLWACSPYLCAQNFNWSLSFVISLRYFKFSPYYLYLYFSPPLLSFHYLSTLISSFFSPCTNVFVISPPITYIFVSLPFHYLCALFLPLYHQWPQRLEI